MRGLVVVVHERERDIVVHLQRRLRRARLVPNDERAVQSVDVLLKSVAVVPCVAGVRGIGLETVVWYVRNRVGHASPLAAAHLPYVPAVEARNVYVSDPPGGMKHCDTPGTPSE